MRPLERRLVTMPPVSVSQTWPSTALIMVLRPVLPPYVVSK